MGYTHYFTFKTIRGQAEQLEAKYQKAIKDCQRVVKHYYKENGGIAGYSAHTKLGQYGGLQVNGKAPDDCESFELREHFSQNLESDFKGFCKTARLPYDTVVIACLAILKHRLGDAFSVSSDGDASDWIEGVNLAKNVTELMIKNPIPARVKIDVA